MAEAVRRDVSDKDIRMLAGAILDYLCQQLKWKRISEILFLFICIVISLGLIIWLGKRLVIGPGSTLLIKSLTLLFAVASSLAETERNEPLNYVVIFVDDLGYGDIGPFGSKLNRTPHLESRGGVGNREGTWGCTQVPAPKHIEALVRRPHPENRILPQAVIYSK